MTMTMTDPADTARPDAVLAPYANEWFQKGYNAALAADTARPESLLRRLRRESLERDRTADAARPGLAHCAGCSGWVTHGTHDEGYECPGNIALAADTARPGLDVEALGKALEATSDDYTNDVQRDPTLDGGRDTKWLTGNRFSWHKYATQVAARLTEKRP